MAEMKKDRMEIRRGDWVGSVFKESQTLTQEDLNMQINSLIQKLCKRAPILMGLRGLRT